ncbi:30S ribosomal protein S9 [Candidatus Beckwithbacteria bacterium]|nr:30S ribosomal protein S9 [Candidatus Beckwithbacteria bacterium]
MEETKKTIKTKKVDYLYAVGRRKSAIARVRLYLTEKGEIEVNGKRIEEYFPGALNKSLYLEPLRTCNVIGKYKINIVVDGSGKASQLEAVIHGLSRCLVKIDEERFRPILKKRGFLTRDPRSRERRNVGMGGKSRRKRQSPRR